jgi:hypothetical protein
MHISNFRPCNPRNRTPATTPHTTQFQSKCVRGFYIHSSDIKGVHFSSLEMFSPIHEIPPQCAEIPPHCEISCNHGQLNNLTHHRFIYLCPMKSTLRTLAPYAIFCAVHVGSVLWTLRFQAPCLLHEHADYIVMLPMSLSTRLNRARSALLTLRITMSASISRYETIWWNIHTLDLHIRDLICRHACAPPDHSLTVIMRYHASITCLGARSVCVALEI